MSFQPTFPRAAGGTAVLAKIQSAEYTMTFDTSDGSAEVTAKLTFEMPHDGHPALDLVPEPRDVLIDATRYDLFVERFGDEGSRSVCRVLSKPLAARAAPYGLALSYALPPGTYAAGAFATSMTDESDRGFLERWLPTGFEDNPYPAKLTLKINTGATAAAPHFLLTNGVVTPAYDPLKAERSEWVINFPGNFSCSSFYFAVGAGTGHQATSFVYDHAGAQLPMTILYRTHLASQVGLLKDAIRKALGDLVDIFGALPRRLPDTAPTLAVNYLDDAAMEYAGAIELSLARHAVYHELTHQYIGRYVMPMDGSAAWFDEAIAEWIRNGEGSTTVDPVDVVPLAGSPWQRHSARAGYEQGHHLIRRLDGYNVDIPAFLRRLVARGSERWSNDELKAELQRHGAHPDAIKLWAQHVQVAPTSRTRCALVAKLAKRVDHRQAFQAEPEEYLDASGIAAGEVPVFMSLDPSVIAAHIADLEDLSDEEEAVLASETADAVSHDPHRRPGTKDLSSPITESVAVGARNINTRGGAGGWPHPNPRVNRIDPDRGTRRAAIQITVWADGLMDGARLFFHDSALSRRAAVPPATASVLRVDRPVPNAPVPYSDRILRGAILLPDPPEARTYVVGVQNAPGTPIIWGPAFRVE